MDDESSLDEEQRQALFAQTHTSGKELHAMRAKAVRKPGKGRKLRPRIGEFPNGAGSHFRLEEALLALESTSSLLEAARDILKTMPRPGAQGRWLDTLLALICGRVMAAWAKRSQGWDGAGAGSNGKTATPFKL